MKLVIDEKLKHRLVGLSVVLSLAAIFLPAIMKKSSQRLENNFSVKVQLPPKPAAPNIVMTHENDLFKTIKVAKIETSSEINQQELDSGKKDFIPSVQIGSVSAAHTAKMELASDGVVEPIELAVTHVKKNSAKKQLNIAEKKPAQPAVQIKVHKIKKESAAKVSNRNFLNKKSMYAVQLASFSKLSNAQALVNKVRSKGYKAKYIKTTARNGVSYKVYAGHSSTKSDVIKLQTQLATAVQLHGFVVNTGVS